MTHFITKEQYINDPCGTCSTTFWKNAFHQKPDDIQIVHEKDLLAVYIEEYHITRYFRLMHILNDLTTATLPAGYIVQTVNIATQKAVVSDFINLCYYDMQTTPQQVDSWTKYEVFDNDLWLFICEKDSLSPVALGVADFDKEMKEGSLEWIQVLPEKRGMGFGQAVVGELLIRLKPKASFATVSGQSDNKTNPESLYRKCGFMGNDIWCVMRRK